MWRANRGSRCFLKAAPLAAKAGIAGRPAFPAGRPKSVEMRHAFSGQPIDVRRVTREYEAEKALEKCEGESAAGRGAPSAQKASRRLLRKSPDAARRRAAGTAPRASRGGRSAPGTSPRAPPAPPLSPDVPRWPGRASARRTPPDRSPVQASSRSQNVANRPPYPLIIPIPPAFARLTGPDSRQTQAQRTTG